jgi:hypothetical protein
MEIAQAARRAGGKLQAMRCIVKTFRRTPTGRLRDRNGGLPSPWVFISASWY